MYNVSHIEYITTNILLWIIHVTHDDDNDGHGQGHGYGHGDDGDDDDDDDDDSWQKFWKCR